MDIFCSIDLFFCRVQDNACCTDGEECPIFNDASFPVTQDDVVHEGSGIAGPIAEHILQSAFLVPFHAHHAMGHVYTGVYGLEGAVNLVALHIAADDVVAHLERQVLLVVEHILYHGQVAVAMVGNVLVWIVLFLGIFQLRYPNADAELLATFRALKYQRLTFVVSLFIEDDVVITLRTTYSFHGSRLYGLTFRTQHSANSMLSLILRRACWASPSVAKRPQTTLACLPLSSSWASEKPL